MEKLLKAHNGPMTASEELSAAITHLMSLGDSYVHLWGSWTLQILDDGGSIVADDVRIFMDSHAPSTFPPGIAGKHPMDQ